MAFLAMFMVEANANGTTANKAITQIGADTNQLMAIIIDAIATKIAPIVGSVVILKGYISFKKGQQEGDGLSAFWWQVVIGLMIAAGPYMVFTAVKALGTETYKIESVK